MKIIPAAIAPAFSLTVNAAGRPNMFFLVTDYQRADSIVAFGDTVVRILGLNRLVRQGPLFSRACMQAATRAFFCSMLLSMRSFFRTDEEFMREEIWPATFDRAGAAPQGSLHPECVMLSACLTIPGFLVIWREGGKMHRKSP